MPKTIQAPVPFLESVASLRLSPRADRRLQKLMDRNSEGQLTPGEREEFESLVDLSQRLSLVRAQAYQLLGKSPV